MGEDFEDVEEDDNMDEMEQPDDDAQIDLLQQGEGGAGQLQTKRITTPYMTKYIHLNNLRLLCSKQCDFSQVRKSTGIRHKSFTNSNVCPCDG